ncbi:MAG: GDYXXLXY domain-containing protein [Patescibacteria group bacterium]|nr:GDYXXLXY domain-containing protein [Patescibacteria group bacterium]
MKKETKIFLGIAIFWLLLVGGIMLPNQITVWSGQEVLIKAVPYDPADIFRGNYMDLRYDINRIKTDRKISDIYDASMAAKGTVYVSLEKGADGKVSAGAMSDEKPNGLFIKGKLTQISVGYDQVEYGIERYYFAQADRAKISALLRNGACARVFISFTGKAVLKDLVPCPVK